MTDELTRQRYKLMVADEIRRNRPADTAIADTIVDHLFAMPQMQDEASVLMFIDSYRRQVADMREKGLI